MLPWFHTNKKGSRLLGFVVLKFRKQTCKTTWQGSINNVMCAHASNQGEFFTSLLSECGANFYPPNCRFPAQIFPETLDASRKEGFKIIFSRSLPLSRLTVERDRTFPAALLSKKVCSQSDICRIFFRPRDWQLTCFIKLWEKIVSDPEEMQNDFWWSSMA